MTEYVVDWSYDRPGYIGFYKVKEKSFAFKSEGFPDPKNKGSKVKDFNYYEATGLPIVFFDPGNNFSFDKRKEIPLIDIREDQFFTDINEARKLFIKELFEIKI